MPERPDPKAEKKPVAVDSYPAPVTMTAEALRLNADLHTAHARNERLKSLARRNRDVAWLLSQVGEKPFKVAKAK